MDAALIDSFAQPSPRHGLRCALAGLIPPASLVGIFLLTMLLSTRLQHVSQGVGAAIGLLLVLTGLAAGGGIWAHALARITGLPATWRIVIAGALSQASMTVLAIAVLGRLEVELVERSRTALPMHVLFTLLFVPATFICAAAVGGAMGLAVGEGRLAGRLALRGGCAAALAFLALNVLQDLLGRRVGGPNAAATATMITVTLICSAGASMAMSAVFGRALLQWRRAHA